MILFDFFRKRRERKKAAAEEASAEILWKSLSKNPNQEEKLKRLVALCTKHTGRDGAIAALEELSRVKGSVLPGQMLQSLYRTAPQRVVSYDMKFDVPDISKSRSDDNEDLQREMRHAEAAQNDQAESYKEETVERIGYETDGQKTYPQAEIWPQDEAGNTFLFALDGPVWSVVFPDLAAYIPAKKDMGRVGFHLYSCIQRPDSEGISSLLESALKPEDLAIGLPLCLSEQLFFQTRYQSVALCPIHYQTGIATEQLEADVQTLQAICVQMKLDYLVTGTVTPHKNACSIRTYVFHKAQKSIRIISQDIHAKSIGKNIKTLTDKICGLFSEKESAQYTARADEIAYDSLDERFISLYLEGEKELLLQFMAYRSYCKPDIPLAFGSIPETFDKLIAGEPHNQAVFLKLFCSMYMDRALGWMNYHGGQSALLYGARRNKEYPFFEVLADSVKGLLEDAG